MKKSSIFLFFIFAITSATTLFLFDQVNIKVVVVAFCLSVGLVLFVEYAYTKEIEESESVGLSD